MLSVNILVDGFCGAQVTLRNGWEWRMEESGSARYLSSCCSSSGWPSTPAFSSFSWQALLLLTFWDTWERQDLLVFSLPLSVFLSNSKLSHDPRKIRLLSYLRSKLKRWQGIQNQVINCAHTHTHKKKGKKKNSPAEFRWIPGLKKEARSFIVS